MNNKNQTILLLDDDEELCEAVSTYLSQNNYTVVVAHAPSVAYQIILKNKPDLILLDVMLPEEDGFNVCKKLVTDTDQYGFSPIIMLTARGDVFDRVIGLEIGASDYLPKPFEPRELLARIRSTLRQATLIKSSHITIEKNTVPSIGLFLDTQTNQVWLDGNLLNLTGMEYSLLSLFFQKPGTIINRDQIMDHLRGTDANIYSRAIDALVKRLRKKLKDESQKPRFIKTVWGRGYEFLGPDINQPNSNIKNKHV